MAKYYLRGRFLNNYKKFKPAFGWPEGFLDSDTVVDKTFISLVRSQKLGRINDFLKTLIIRGIGYRSFTARNDITHFGTLKKFVNAIMRPEYSNVIIKPDAVVLDQVNRFEFEYNKYLLVRAGHTYDLWLPLSAKLSARSLKKDRKLVVYGSCGVTVSKVAKLIWKYRRPNIYTGRGVRFKHAKVVRKAGKKDKQKGKAF